MPLEAGSHVLIPTALRHRPDCPFLYNNFICRVRLTESPTKLAAAPQPATVPLPATTTQVVMRLTNAAAAAGFNNANRVENEVAAMAFNEHSTQSQGKKCSVSTRYSASISLR
ncbi:phosphotransferase enzyme family protein [Lasiodiplodia theobromae]|nr:phosphotransferase enzyme family protein [Lasiodiplodia theobromae]